MEKSETDPKIHTNISAGSETDTSSETRTETLTENRIEVDTLSADGSDEQRVNYIQQLRWRSRRGLLELELLLLPFATDCLDTVAEAALGDYERLLGCEDLDIYDWLQKRSAPDDDSLLKIVAAIRDYQQSLKRA